MNFLTTYYVLMGKKLLKLISHIRKAGVFSVTVIFVCGLLFIPNDKLTFAWSAVYVFAVFFQTLSLEKTLLYLFIPLSLVRVGQTYSFLVVPPSITIGDDYPVGKFLEYVFSPSQAFHMTMITGFVISMIKKRRIPVLSTSGFFLLIMVALVVFSSVNSHFLPFLSLFYDLGLVGSFCWAWLFLSELASGISLKKIGKTLWFQLGVSMIFISFIAISQFILRSSLGINIETTHDLPSYGGAADENSVLFRPIGLQAHANILANEMTISFFSFLLLFFLYRSYAVDTSISFVDKLFNIIVMGSTIVTLIITQSRAAYLALIVSGLIFALFHQELFVKYSHKILGLIKNLGILGIVLVVITIFLITDRGLHSVNSFSKSGGISTRAILEKEAWSLFEKYPFFGVGNGMFIPANYQNNPSGISRSFPESVHNGLILILIENGVLTFLMYSLGIFFLLREILFGTLNSSIKWVAGLGLLSQTIIMIFHPFSNMLTFTVILLVAVAGLSFSDYEEKKSV